MQAVPPGDDADADGEAAQSTVEAAELEAQDGVCVVTLAKGMTGAGFGIRVDRSGTIIEAAAHTQVPCLPHCDRLVCSIHRASGDGGGQQLAVCLSCLCSLARCLQGLGLSSLIGRRVVGVNGVATVSKRDMLGVLSSPHHSPARPVLPTPLLYPRVSRHVLKGCIHATARGRSDSLSP